jgi:hypothetical protein
LLRCFLPKGFAASAEGFEPATILVTEAFPVNATHILPHGKASRFLQ